MELETLKLLKGDHRCRKDSLNGAPLALESQPTVNKWDLVKLKYFSTVRQTINHVERKACGIGETLPAINLIED